MAKRASTILRALRYFSLAVGVLLLLGGAARAQILNQPVTLEGTVVAVNGQTVQLADGIIVDISNHDLIASSLLGLTPVEIVPGSRVVLAGAFNEQTNIYVAQTGIVQHPSDIVLEGKLQKVNFKQRMLTIFNRKFVVDKDVIELTPFDNLQEGRNVILMARVKGKRLRVLQLFQPNMPRNPNGLLRGVVGRVSGTKVQLAKGKIRLDISIARIFANFQDRLPPSVITPGTSVFAFPTAVPISNDPKVVDISFVSLDPANSGRRTGRLQQLDVTTSSITIFNQPILVTEATGIFLFDGEMSRRGRIADLIPDKELTVRYTLENGRLVAFDISQNTF